MNRRVACLLALTLGSVGVLHAEELTLEQGLSRSPNNFISGMTQAVSFEGCSNEPEGEICSVRVKLLEPYAFTSPDTEQAPKSFLLRVSPDTGQQPIDPRQCMVFATPVGKSGVYDATHTVCDPSPAAVVEFRDELKRTLLRRLHWMPELVP